LAAFAATVVPSAARAQRQQAPGPDTKRVLVTTFRGDVEGGVRTADEIRNRVANDFNIRTLMPNSKKDIDATLLQSGYRADSALSPNDIKELAKLLRADEVIDGTVVKTPAGYRVNARFFLPRDAGLSQPLVSTESNNLGDVARDVVHEYDQARKQLQANQECENAIRDKNLPAAIAAARRGIQTYPKATLARLCLASAFQAMKSAPDSARNGWADSVLAVTREVTALDKQSGIAYRLQYDAYKAKNDTANALQSLVGLMNADPTNSTLREQVIAELVQSGKPEVAIPITKQLVADNPGDPQYARTYWLVLRAARRYKESVPAGQQYVALDTAAADSGYYTRMAFDLAADSNFARAAEMAAMGAAKYPRSTTLLVIKAQNERKEGQLPAAKASVERAIAIDPKASGAYQLLISIDSDLGDIPGAVAAAKADVAADPSNKERDAAYLLSVGNQAYKKGVASKKMEDYKTAFDVVKASDDISPSDNAALLLGVTAFSQMQQHGQDYQKSKSCADARATAEDLTNINTYMPRGGKVNAEAAKQILGAAGQYQAFVDTAVKKSCK
jgi:tetratricopeptide (TPR) repeat protein